MKIDLCTLTADLLPLYGEELLSPETRQLVEEHAATCPSCRERLQSARGGVAMVVPPPPPALEQPARRFFGRLRRLLRYGLVSIAILLVVVGGLSYRIGRRSGPVVSRIPMRVSGADDLAHRAVPGWNLAREQGLIFPIGATQRVDGSEATITLEKGWYSKGRAYLLYTVTAEKGKHVLPVQGLLARMDTQKKIAYGETDWDRLSQWGGFSPKGFHGIFIMSQLEEPPEETEVELTIRQWAPVFPTAGMIDERATRRDLSLRFTWKSLEEPEPEVHALAQRQSWLGRTLALEQLQVSAGEMRLTGWMELPAGETSPWLGARLLVDGQERRQREFRAEPMEGGNRYRFAAAFDGPDQWPAPVSLKLSAIEFRTEQPLEWPIPWAKYQGSGENEAPMAPADQTVVAFYDSQITSHIAWEGGISLAQRDPSGRPPYVRAALHGAGRGLDDDRPGFELVNDQGEVHQNMGGGGGSFQDETGTIRQRISVIWHDQLPDGFRRSDRLLLRYVYPSATMVLDETWPLL